MRAYFEIFGEVAKMWSDLSIENIMPGIQLLVGISSGFAGQLGKDPKESRDKVMESVKKLNNWFTDAKAKIEDLAGKVSAPIRALCLANTPSIWYHQEPTLTPSPGAREDSRPDGQPHSTSRRRHHKVATSRTDDRRSHQYRRS